ncbi:imelysin family protein [Aquimarina pacifica]|uniref:imelysin family protein n=1 Tax=Aquimarina pacifica TaxID=1296415 RepID=UPI000471401E|nr:imelysin family protein [Aquimarina pacifica]
MIKRFFAVAFLFVIAFSCTESDDSSETGGDTNDFDRGALLTNLADNIIIPSYENLNNELDALVISKNTFIETPNEENLSNLQDSWLEAYKAWQYVEVFNIGKAEEILYHFQMNIYPTTVADIENNIASGNYDLTIPNNNDAVGFPAIDYLLYGIAETEEAILAKYSTGSEAEKHKTYLSDVINQMKLLTEEVLSSWTNGYRDTFVSSTENTASSAVNKFVNDFIFYYEKGLRANKIGIPAGVFSTTPLPEKVEAFYNKEISKELSIIALEAVKDIFNGNHYNGSGSGASFASYLTALDKADLSTMINDQFEAAEEKIEALDENFFEQVNTDNTKMTQSYDALQTAVVLLKVDMLQVFNISVDYVDADGD